MRTSLSITPALVAVALGLTIGATAAEARAYPAEVKKACKRDFKTFCPSYDIDGTAVRQCMRSVADQLSPRCIEALEKSGERRKK